MDRVFNISSDNISAWISYKIFYKVAGNSKRRIYFLNARKLPDDSYFRPEEANREVDIVGL